MLLKFSGALLFVPHKYTKGVFMPINKIPICLVPWNDLVIIADRKFGVCCSDKKYYKNDFKSFSEHWNSDLMKALRVKLMNGELDEEICFRCLPQNLNSPRLASSGSTDRAMLHIKEILEKTSEDGHTDYFPRHLDFRTDLCNFKCRMCYPNFSTSIQAECKKHNVYIDPRGTIDSVEAAELDDEKLSRFNFLCWAGGEPFMSPIHWQVMNKLVELGNTTPSIFYYTNLSFPGNTIDKAVTLLKNFNNVRMGMSIDGSGEDVEYIRDGLVYEKFIANVIRVHNDLPNVKKIFEYAATSMGLLSAVDVLKLCDDYDADLEGRISVVKDNHPLAIHVLKPEIFESAMKNMEEFSKGKKIEKTVFKFTKFLRGKYKPCVVDWNFLNIQESRRGKAGYYANRMNGLLNE
jgi:organic radical activating enzyme